MDARVENRQPCDVENAYAVVSNCFLDPNSTDDICCCEMRLYYLTPQGDPGSPDIIDLRFESTGNIDEYANSYNVLNNNIICLDTDQLGSISSVGEFIIEWRNPFYNPDPLINPNQLPLHCVTINATDLNGCF